MALGELIAMVNVHLLHTILECSVGLSCDALFHILCIAGLIFRLAFLEIAKPFRTKRRIKLENTISGEKVDLSVNKPGSS